MFGLYLFNRKQIAGIHGHLNRLEDQLMATKEAFIEALNNLGASVDKIGTETRALKEKVQELEDALNNAGGQIPADVMAAFQAVKDKVTAVDDLVPDSTPVESTGEPAPNPGQTPAGGTNP